MDVARLGIQIDSSQAERGARDLKVLSGAAQTAENSAERLAASNTAAEASTSRLANAAQTAATQTRVAAAANQALATSSRNAAFQQRNLVFQLGDVFQSIALGLPIQQTLLQQGPQIAQIYGPDEGGIGRAFRETGNLIVGFVRKFALIGGVVGVGAAAFTAFRNEVRAATGEQVTFGDVALASFQVVKDGVLNLLQPAVSIIGPIFSRAYDLVISTTKTVGNAIINGFRLAFSEVGFLVGNFPTVVGNAFFTAVNNALKQIDRLTEGVRSGLNSAIRGINEVTGSTFGELGSFGSVGTVNNPFEQDSARINLTRQGRRQLISQSDPLGDFFNAVSQRAVANAQSRIEDVGGAVDGVSASTRAANDNFRTSGTVATEAFSGAREIAGGFFTTIRNGIQQGQGLWDSFKQAGLNALNAIAQRLQDSALDSLFGGGNSPLDLGRSRGGGGGGGLFSSILGSLFGGFRADGGPVNPNQAFVVGERGPELFVPPSVGNIIPNGQMQAANSNNSSGGTVIINQSFSFDGTVSRDEVMEMAAGAGQQAGAAAVQTVRGNLPDWQAQIQRDGSLGS